jgi:outer membrane receptor protein involved in Fe transport
LLVPHDGRTYNYAPVNYLQTPYERANVFVEGKFEVTQDISFNFEMRGNDRTSSQELAPLPFTGGDPMHNGFYLDPATGNQTAYTGVSENNYYLRAAVDAFNAANAAGIAAGTTTALIYEPLVNPRRRMIETKRRFEQDVKQYQFLAELEGEFNEMNWNVFVSDGYRTRSDVDYGQFSGDRLNNALGPSADLDGNGQPECYEDVTDPNTLIVGCVPLNLFGGGEVDAGGSVTTATLTPDMIAYVSTTLNDTLVGRQRTGGASLSGNAMELPGGPLGWAVGYSYYKQEFTYTPDSAKILGAATGNVGAGTDGSLTNNGYYGEVLAPVFDNGEQSLIVDAGIRYDDWDALGGDTTWQLGVEFNVMQDVKLRATGGTVFRAPGIGALFGGLIDSFPTYSDPCDIDQDNDGVPDSTLPAGCAQASNQLDSQLPASVGGNPNLQPETGDTFTAGLVWTPTFGENNISLTVDYWQIDLDNGISSLGVQKILDDCHIDQSAQACALITRQLDANYTITNVLDAALNVATQGARGVDTEVRWGFASDYGQWQLSVLWAHNLERTKTPFPGAPEEELVGRYTDPTAADGGGYPENKFNYTVQWAMNDFTVAYKGEFIGQMDADTFCNCGAGNRPDGSYIQDIDSELYHDLVGQWDAPYGFKVSGGITNLTDEAPPYIEVGFNATTDPPIYREFGRGYYLRVGWEY